MKSAVIGLGRIGFRNGIDYFSNPSDNLESHTGAIHRSDELVLSAVCDSNVNLLSKFRLIDPSVNVFTQAAIMFQNTEIDLLTIATRTSGRIALLSDAIKFGIRNFHIEKPLCQSRRELDELKEILTLDDNIIFTFGATRRYLRIFLSAKFLCSTENFGKVKRVQINIGEKSLFWTHPHSIDLLLFFLEEYESPSIKYIGDELEFISDSTSKFIRNDPIVRHLELEFSSGKQGVISNSNSNEIEIELDFANILIKQNDNQILVKDNLNSNSRIYFFPKDEKSMQGISSALGQHLLFKKSKETKLRIRQNMSDAIRGQELLFEICESILKSQRVNLTHQEIIDLVFMSESIEGFQA